MKVMLHSFQHLDLSLARWLSVSLIWCFSTENTCAPPGQKVKQNVIVDPPSNEQKLSSYSQPPETLDEAIWRVILPSSRFWKLLPTNLPLSGELPSRRGEQDLWLESGLSNSFSGKTFLIDVEWFIPQMPSSNAATLGWHLCFACPLPWIWERWVLWLMLMYGSLA